MLDALLVASLPISRLGTGSDYVDLHTLRLGNLVEVANNSNKCIGDDTKATAR